MIVLKNKLVPGLWVLGGVASLVPAVGPVIKGGSLDYTFLAIAFTVWPAECLITSSGP
jgi:hypothetical protein